MSKRHRRSSSRRDHIGSWVSALPRFLAGAAALPPFLLLDDLTIKAALLIVFALTALASGKRIRWAYFSILAGSICFFHLLAPLGRVLFRLGPFPITAGALENGAFRSATLIGMVFLSISAVRPELKLPGRLGGLLGRTFYHFEAIIDGKAELRWKDFFGQLDAFLLRRFNPEQAEFGMATSEESEELSAAPRGWIYSLFFAAIPWGLWIWSETGLPWT